MRSGSKLALALVAGIAAPTLALAHGSARDKISLARDASVNLAEAQARADGKITEVDVDAQKGDVIDSEARK